MKESRRASEYHHTDTRRGESFADAVLAIIITILVLELQPPDVPPGQLGTGLYMPSPAAKRSPSLGASRSSSPLVHFYDLGRYSTIHAYGDTREDAELLELATRRYYRWRELPAEGGVLRERLGTRPTR